MRIPVGEKRTENTNNSEQTRSQSLCLSCQCGLLACFVVGWVCEVCSSIVFPGE